MTVYVIVSPWSSVNVGIVYVSVTSSIAWISEMEPEYEGWVLFITVRLKVSLVWSYL